MVGDDLLVVAAKRQLCPTISEITFGKRSIKQRTNVRRVRIVFIAILVRVGPRAFALRATGTKSFDYSSPTIAFAASISPFASVAVS